MRTYLYIMLSSIFSLIACIRQSDQKGDASVVSSSSDTAQMVIDRAIQTHGGELYDHSFISFDFRDRTYTRKRQEGMFEYERIFTDPEDSTQNIRDVLNNEGFQREINGTEVSVPDTMASKYSNSINSVIYFALLPYRLNDVAAIKKYLGKSPIKGISYHKIEVTFRKEGGGKDYDDIFIYWIHPEKYTVDFFAYLFHVDGGGIRFREAINSRVIEGLRFQDYVNYKMPDTYTVAEADRFYVNDGLEKLSEILLEKVTVEILE